VTSPNQIEAFAAAFGPDSVKQVAGAGHFAQGEQPETYANLVLEFVRSFGDGGRSAGFNSAISGHRAGS
jgi:hypothetical protein